MAAMEKALRALATASTLDYRAEALSRASTLPPSAITGPNSLQGRVAKDAHQPDEVKRECDQGCPRMARLARRSSP